MKKSQNNQKPVPDSDPVEKNNASGPENKSLSMLFEDMIKDIYWAENALVNALPKMSASATSENLANALNEHLSVTENQVTRLGEIFNLMGKPVQARKCQAMEGLIMEGEEIIQTTRGAVRDAGIIASAQKVEHYEIAAYGTLVALAEELGEREVAALLNETLTEEKDSDEILSELSATVNADAASR